MYTYLVWSGRSKLPPPMFLTLQDSLEGILQCHTPTSNPSEPMFVADIPLQKSSARFVVW